MKIGVVTHYYPRIGVAIVNLTGAIHLKDRIRFQGATEFSQSVTSIQIEHEQIDSASAGTTVGIKVTKAVAPHDEVILQRI